ncbi:MAG: hypothetical protein GC136_07045 [Alphaproteobacteria bacterium]|nr:hypothetical protein [Alphaproteobacteria bacterium]
MKTPAPSQQMLPLSLFIILLTFFLALMPHLSFDKERVGEVLESVGKSFQMEIKLPIIENIIEGPITDNASTEKQAGDIALRAESLWPKARETSIRRSGDEIMFFIPEADFFAVMNTEAGKLWAQDLAQEIKNNKTFRIDFFAFTQDVSNENKINELKDNLQAFSDFLETQGGFAKATFSIGIAEGEDAGRVAVILRRQDEISDGGGL